MQQRRETVRVMSLPFRWILQRSGFLLKLPDQSGNFLIFREKQSLMPALLQIGLMGFGALTVKPLIRLFMNLLIRQGSEQNILFQAIPQ